MLFSRRSRRRPAVSQSAQLNVETLETRLVPYTVSGSAWSAHPELITISFVPDGTSVNGKTSNLFATFNAKFGSAATWQNQFLKAAQQWAMNTNINFALVSDNGGAGGSGSYMQGNPGFGDIRISGYDFGNTTLAQAYLPPMANNYSVAGDIQFNTSRTFNIGTTYDVFTVAMHEFGHALGLYHSTTSGTAMYATYGSVMTGLATDDINGIRNIYSANAARANDSYDATAANNTAATATVITSAINTTTKAGVINGRDLTTSTDVDWYKFVVPTGSAATLKVIAKSAGLSLLDPNVAIYDSTGTILKASGNAGTYGGTATATFTGIAAGQTYTIKVSSTNAITAFKTGKYALILNMGTGADPAPTYPNTTTANGSPLTSGGGQALQLNSNDVQINTTTANFQQTSGSGHQNVAVDKNGNYVVTWASNLQDGSGWGIYAQRYNSAGVAQGTEFRVNTTTAWNQTDPSIAMDSNGNFVITWTSANQDGSGLGVYAQRFGSSGLAQGGEFRVNTTTAGDQFDAAVASDRNGNLVVTWTSANQDGSGLGVYAQRFDSAGVAQGAEFRVNSTTTGDQSDASVAIDRNGIFVIAWTSAGQDGSGNGVYAQRFSSSGIVQGSEFRVNSTTANDQQSAAVAMKNNGGFAIVWASYGQDAAGSWGIYGQAYKADGSLDGPLTLINTTTSGDQINPSVDVDSNNNYLVTWTSVGQDGGGKGVYGQIINAGDCSKLDGEFRLNITTAGDQQAASVAVGKLGQAVVVWTGNDAGSTGVFAGRFDLTMDAYEAPTSEYAKRNQGFTFLGSPLVDGPGLASGSTNGFEASLTTTQSADTQSTDDILEMYQQSHRRKAGEMPGNDVDVLGTTAAALESDDEHGSYGIDGLTDRADIFSDYLDSAVLENAS